MLYNWIKILHVISSVVLFGVGIGTAFYMLLVNLRKDVKMIAKATQQVVVADWLFTGVSGVLQPVTGFAMVFIKGYSLTAFWVLGSFVGYVIAALCWFPVVYLQIKCRDIALDCSQNQTPLPRRYYRYFVSWWILGIPAFLSLIVVFYLMANGPSMA